MARQVPWYESLAMLVEVTDGGDIIQPILPGVVPIALPQFVGSGELAAGWAKYQPNGVDADVIWWVGPGPTGFPDVIQGVRSFSATPEHRYGVITTAFTPVTMGHVYRATMRVQLRIGMTDAASANFIRIEGYGPSDTTILAAWESSLVYKDAWVTLQVVTEAIPANITRIRIMAGGLLYPATAYRAVWFLDPYLWDDPNTGTQPPLVPLSWRDITCDVQSTSIRYGREKLTDRFDVASFSLVLRNHDGDYTYSNPHPERFGPGALVRVSAIHDGITYPMAYGVIDSIVDDTDIEGKNTVVVSAFDPTSLWASINWRTTYGVSNGVGELSGARINRLLDYVSYTSRSVDAGTIALQALPAVSGRPLRDDAGIAADTEGGAIYAERNGSIVFRDSTWRTNATYAQSVQANITAQDDAVSHASFDYISDAPGAPVICPHELVTDWSLRRLINRVALANAGGVAQTFDHLPSQRLYGVRGYQRLDYIGTSDGYLAARANALLDKFDTPKLRVNAVTYRPAQAGTDDAWRFTLSVFFQWLVRVWYHNPIDDWGYAVAAYVQGIEHRITPTDWVTTLRLDDPAMFMNTDGGTNRPSVWALATDTQPLWDSAVWA